MKQHMLIRVIRLCLEVGILIYLYIVWFKRVNACASVLYGYRKALLKILEPWLTALAQVRRSRCRACPGLISGEVARHALVTSGRAQ